MSVDKAERFFYVKLFLEEASAGGMLVSDANCRPSLHLIPYFVSGRTGILHNVQTSVQWSGEIWDETEGPFHKDP